MSEHQENEERTSPPNHIIVSIVHGVVASVGQIPDDFVVEIRDHDVDHTGAGIHNDEEGPYEFTLFHADGSITKDV